MTRTISERTDDLPNLMVSALSEVVTITINRPEVRNAIDQSTWRDLLTAVEWLASSTCRVIILRGAGDQAFSAGVDLKELASIYPDESASRDYVELMEEVFASIESSPQVVIAMVGGSAIGAGAELAVAADIRIAGEGVVIGIPAVRLGLAMTMRDIERLDRLIGSGRAKWLAYSGGLITADTALDWGLVDDVIRARELESATYRLAEEISRNSPVSLRLMKQSFVRIRPNSHANIWQSVGPAWTSSDLREGMEARTQRRLPNFVGR